jgi:3-hydroxyacyl-CoA dehydrogenase
MNRDRLLADAKARVLAMADGYHPPEPPVFHLPGANGKTALDLAVQGFRARGLATPHDETVSGALARILTGGEADVVDTVTEQDLLAAERREFIKLVRNPATQARIEHMLLTGKPLRN